MQVNTNYVQLWSFLSSRKIQDPRPKTLCFAYISQKFIESASTLQRSGGDIREHHSPYVTLKQIMLKQNTIDVILRFKYNTSLIDILGLMLSGTVAWVLLKQKELIQPSVQVHVRRQVTFCQVQRQCPPSPPPISLISVFTKASTAVPLVRQYAPTVHTQLQALAWLNEQSITHN